MSENKKDIFEEMWKVGARIKGRCPACHSESLFIGGGGYITCSVIGCKDPGAANDLLNQPIHDPRMSSPVEREMAQPRKRYFGVPGVCVDINGDLWHKPGDCPNCGYEDVLAPSSPAEQRETDCGERLGNNVCVMRKGHAGGHNFFEPETTQDTPWRILPVQGRDEFVVITKQGHEITREHASEIMQWERIVAAVNGEVYRNNAIESLNGEVNRLRPLEAENQRLKDAVETLLKSACPHPTEHPSMYAAHPKARGVLAACAVAIAPALSRCSSVDGGLRCIRESGHYGGHHYNSADPGDAVA